MKSFLLSTAMVLSIASTSSYALAADDKEKNTAVGVKAENGVEVQIGGSLDVQYGSVSQNKDMKNPAKINGAVIGGGQDDINKMRINGKFKEKTDNGLANNTKLKFGIKKKDAGCNIEYGGNIEINADVSQTSSFGKNIANKTVIYTQGDFGRVEMGSYDGAGNSLRISGLTLAKATGGIDGDYINWIPFRAVSKSNGYVMNSLFLSDPYLPYSTDHSKKSNKITYYTPNFNGLSVGISYIPDTDIKGTVAETIQFRTGGYKNVVDGGVRYKQKFDNGFEIAGSAIAEFGQAKDVSLDADSAFNPVFKQGSTLKRENLQAWELGAQIGYKGLALAGSYGDWGKSGSIKEAKDANGADRNYKMKNKKTQFWTLGASCTADKFGASVTYMNSQRGNGSVTSLYDYLNLANIKADAESGKNTMEAVSLGFEYKVMPGLMPYAELTKFSYKTKIKDITSNDGSVFIAGVKISF